MGVGVRRDCINIHQRPMFGWLKFVGLAGNFAPLPPLLCSSMREERRRHRGEKGEGKRIGRMEKDEDEQG